MTLLFVLHSPALAGPASLPPGLDRLATVKKLYAEKRWNEIVRLTPDSPDAPAELDYYRGMALARLQRWGEAKEAFEAGQRQQPSDVRFPLELAGVAFKQKNFSEARSELRLALRLDPRNPYAINFLATLYLLDHNLEAALQEWNRIGKPKIAQVKVDPQPLVDPVLLSRAFAFAPASVLNLEDYRATRARIELLDIFPRFQFELLPRTDQEQLNDEQFDALFRAVERNGWGGGRVEGILSLLRGVPYQTVYPEFYNLRHSALNFTSLARWDAQKRRVSSSFSAPLRRDPKWRYLFYLDGRNEIWDLSQTLHQPGPPLDNLTVQTARAGAQIQAVVDPRFKWTSGADLSYRRFRNRDGSELPAGPFFTNGFALKYQAGLNYELLNLPDRRLTVESGGSGQIGRIFTRHSNLFSRLEGSLLAHWFPKSHGDDYEMTGRFRAGKTFGNIPFDELFILALERDNDLWLRAHIGTSHGKKGSAPLGRDYLLSNWEVNKTVYDRGFLKVRLGPFLDSGKIYGESGDFGSARWLWDTGGQVKVSILESFTVALSYGKDLRSGRNAFYTLVRK